MIASVNRMPFITSYDDYNNMNDYRLLCLLLGIVCSERLSLGVQVDSNICKNGSKLVGESYISDECLGRCECQAGTVPDCKPLCLINDTLCFPEQVEKEIRHQVHNTVCFYDHHTCINATADDGKTLLSTVRFSPIKVDDEGRYQCRAFLRKNNSVILRTKICTITVHNADPPDVRVNVPATVPPQCPQHSSDHIQWPAAVVGKTIKQRCPGNAIGQATRQCVEGSIRSHHSKPTWKDPDLSNCTRKKIKNYLLQTEKILSRSNVSSDNTSVLLRLLMNATDTNPAKNESLYGGDIRTTIKILSKLVNYNQAHNNTTIIASETDQHNFVQICSNILEAQNQNSWIQAEDNLEKGEKPLWNQLITTANHYGLQVINKITADTDVNRIQYIKAKNVIMGLGRVTQQNKDKIGFNYSEYKSSLLMPAEVFSNDSDAKVVSLAYRTLNDVLRLEQDINGTQDARSVSKTLNTILISSVVRPIPVGKFEEKVKIVMKNKQRVERFTPRKCVFWRKGLTSVWRTEGCSLVPRESNQHVTTCECDHLTIFAALMDLHASQTSGVHLKALELISTIGCSISLVAVLLTILVTMSFWVQLKASRTVVLMNLCVAIAAVCILVIVEGIARDTKVGCTVIAVMLHYFLLAVFCWMLCEAVLLYSKIVKVIGMDVEDRLSYFLLFGWGFPFLLVSISLAITQTQGYGYYGDQTACWLAIDSGLIWAFVVPAIVVLLVNIVVFILVLRQLMNRPSTKSKPRDEQLRMGIKASAIILPCLGITWVFGLLAFNSETLVFKYFFTIFNSLQGLMIFIFHCVLNTQVQDAFKLKINHLGFYSISNDDCSN